MELIKEEVAQLLQSAGNPFADEITVNTSSADDIDEELSQKFMLAKTGKPMGSYGQSLSSVLVNALVHRDYFTLSSIKVFIFDNRIEIIGPGKLPNTLTVDHIKMGTSMPRNPILFTNARYLLPFVGVVSGIPRAIKNSPDLELINDLDREVFVAVIKRPVSAFWRNVCYI